MKSGANVAANERHFVNAISKTAIGMVLLVLLAGCEDKAAKRQHQEEHEHIANLESNLAVVQRKSEDMRTNLSVLWSMVISNSIREVEYHLQVMRSDDANESNYSRIVNLCSLLIEDRSNMEFRLERLENPTNRGARPIVAARPYSSPAPSMREGIPIDVYNKIAAKAAQEWPNSYDLQVTSIRMEVEAYKKLHQ